MVVLIVLAVISVLVIKLSLTVFNLYKKRWRLLKLTESIEDGGLKYPHLLYGNLHEVRIALCVYHSQFYFFTNVDHKGMLHKGIIFDKPLIRRLNIIKPIIIILSFRVGHNPSGRSARKD